MSRSAAAKLFLLSYKQPALEWKKLFQTWPNDATSPPVTSRARWPYPCSVFCYLGPCGQATRHLGPISEISLHPTLPLLMLLCGCSSPVTSFSARPLFNLGVGEKESLQILSFGAIKNFAKIFFKTFLVKIFVLLSREKSESCLNPTTASSCLSHHSRSLSQFTHTFTPTQTDTHTLSLYHTTVQYSDYTHAFSPAHARHALLHPPTLF